MGVRQRGRGSKFGDIANDIAGCTNGALKGPRAALGAAKTHGGYARIAPAPLLYGRFASHRRAATPVRAFEVERRRRQRNPPMWSDMVVG